MNSSISDRKVCVVTGASSGIGAATVRLFASRGWNVAINYSRDASQAESVAQECRAFGVEALPVRADVAIDGDCRRMAEEVRAAWQRVDVLVNSAGITRFVALRDLEGLDAEDFQSIYAINVIGAYQATRAFVPLLKQIDGAAVVNVSSTSSMMGTGSSIAYMASKGALNAMTIGLARALGPEIRVNALAPGMVESERMRVGLGDEAYASRVKAYKDRATLDATLTADDVAEAAWWLGVGARKTTGEILLLDAGLRLAKA